MNTIKNPIIPGYYPDPSICRVGEDYYICCSTFEMYPGLPIWHSKDLANWELIGYAMTKENGFHMDVNSFAGGVMAPTIRYHEGTYYIINCNFADRGNFIVTATNPAGPWSEPHWLDDVPGIDASFFFNEDGKCYIMGTGDVVKRADGTMDRGIWAAEYDIKNYKLIGEPTAIWDSALRGADSPEAPHLYHVGDYYYLIIAEGGTEHYHAVTVARSKNVLGWYEGFKGNPIMTHRMQGYKAKIANVGHADIVETPNGKWYAVMLASRTIGGYHKNFGRETFLTPMEWTPDGWPVFSPETGRVEFEYPADEDLPWTPVEGFPTRDEFDLPELGKHMIFWGTPYDDFYHIKNSKLTLKCLPHPIASPVKPFGYEKVIDDCVASIGRTQRDVSFDLETEMTFTAEGKEEAGLIIMQQSANQYLLRKVAKDGKQMLQLVHNFAITEGYPWLPGYKCTIDSEILEEVSCEENTVVLRIQIREQDYEFFYGADTASLKAFKTHGDGRLLNPVEVGPMTGTYLAMYASSNRTESRNEASFEYFVYQPVEA